MRPKAFPNKVRWSGTFLVNFRRQDKNFWPVERKHKDLSIHCGMILSQMLFQSLSLSIVKQHYSFLFYLKIINKSSAIPHLSAKYNAIQRLLYYQSKCFFSLFTIAPNINLYTTLKRDTSHQFLSHILFFSPLAGKLNTLT